MKLKVNLYFVKIAFYKTGGIVLWCRLNNELYLIRDKKPSTKVVASE